jgi:hypothetical protein
MHPERLKWLPVRWLALLAALLLLAGSIAFSAGGPLSAQTVTTTPTATDGPTTSTPTDTVTLTPTDTTVPPTGTDAATPSASADSPDTTTATPSTPAASGSAVTSSTEDVDYDEEQGRDGPKNIVRVINKNDNRLRVKGKIQLNHIPGQDVEPVNDAEAYGSCTNCATFAVALQIDLISRSVGVIIPKNTAIALNVQCSHCTTVARAVQFVVQVDDPRETPDNVKDLIKQMQKELDSAAHDKDATVDQVEARVNAVIQQFTNLGQSLYNQRDEKTDDNDPGATAPPDAIVLTPTTTP